jgi:hypothetical protein
MSLGARLFQKTNAPIETTSKMAAAAAQIIRELVAGFSAGNGELLRAFCQASSSALKA